MKVLIVEDDPDQLAVRCLMVGHHGYETVAAEDAESAMGAAQECHPGVAIVDIRLPAQADGLALIARLKSEFPEMRLIALTGTNPENLREHSEMRLVDETLLKGGSSKLLMAAVDRLASQRAA